MAGCVDGGIGGGVCMMDGVGGGRGMKSGSTGSGASSNEQNKRDKFLLLLAQ